MPFKAASNCLEVIVHISVLLLDVVLDNLNKRFEIDDGEDYC